MAQAEINALMAAQATLGRRVVRLKAGDPFVFGRGGEEVDYLESRGIAVQVIPGITAALRCAASAAIPLTPLDLSHGVPFLGAPLNAAADGLPWPARPRAAAPLL